MKPELETGINVEIGDQIEEMNSMKTTDFGSLEGEWTFYNSPANPAPVT